MSEATDRKDMAETSLKALLFKAARSGVGSASEEIEDFLYDMIEAVKASIREDERNGY